jgi:putative ABC transport system substrate-binding protein
MQRRNVIAGLAALPLASRRSMGQCASTRIPRVGILSAADSERAPIFDALRQGLRDLGYVEGRNIVLEFRLGRG